MLNQEFFTTLPLVIIIDILARLPVRSILNCKCVCKSWLSLINNDEFSKFHLPKSLPLLGIYHTNVRSRLFTYSLLEVEEGLNFEHYFNPVTNVNLTNYGWINILGSVKGLLFLLDNQCRSHVKFLICNPITREYVKLPSPPFVSFNYHEIAYGCGASKITSQLKVVRMFQKNHKFECYRTKCHRTKCHCECYCEVYNLGTGSWRRIALVPTLKYYNNNIYGSFLNGNLHWVVEDLNGCSWVSCFDLESELFITFSTPNLSCGARHVKMVVAPLGDYLCLCDNSEDGIVIWLMKEYGVEKSWTKEFVIDHFHMSGGMHFKMLYPIKIVNDGVLLIACNGSFLVQCSKKKGISKYSRKYINNKGIDQNSEKSRISQFLDTFYFSGVMLHTPSFISLKSLGIENARSL